MPIGIVSDTEFEEEISGSNPTIESSSRFEDMKTPGRGDTNNTPPVIRKIIGEEASIHGHSAGLEIAKELGISESSVSAYQQGATSTASMDRPDPELIDHIRSARKRVVNNARDTIAACIESINDGDKLQQASIKVASGVARDMASVVKHLEPADEVDTSRTQFVFMVPQMKKESDFAVIDVGDKD